MSDNNLNAFGSLVVSGAEKNAEETSEFFVPQYGLDVEAYIEKESKQGIHHLGRYHWAKDVLQPYSPKKY